MTRRDRFRQYMSHVDPATNPLTAIEKGFYVDPPSSVARQIVGRTEIEPIARQLLVGSIGSGKTTQLLWASRMLNEKGDIAAFYVDVSASMDLTRLDAGWLVAAASKALLDDQPNADVGVRNRITVWCNGHRTSTWKAEPDSKWVPGILSPNIRWPGIYQIHVDDLKALANMYRKEDQDPVLLFDGLDRLSAEHLDRFTKLVEQDVTALHDSGVGVVLVGPVRSLEGFSRVDADHFDFVHQQAQIDVRTAGPEREFLEKVLRQRAGEDILPLSELRLLVEYSGGILRDMMALAKLAGEEAYLDGADSISEEHVRRAVDRFGGALLIGLLPGQIRVLRALMASGDSLLGEHALVATRRVLAYRDEYVVHPALRYLLEREENL